MRKHNKEGFMSPGLASHDQKEKVVLERAKLKKCDNIEAKLDRLIDELKEIRETLDYLKGGPKTYTYEMAKKLIG